MALYDAIVSYEFLGLAICVRSGCASGQPLPPWLACDVDAGGTTWERERDLGFSKQTQNRMRGWRGES